MGAGLKTRPFGPLVDKNGQITQAWYQALLEGGALGVVVDLSDGEVTGRLPFTHLQQVAANKLLGRGSASGTGDAQEITLGTNLTMVGTTLNASGTGGSDAETLAWLAL